MSGDPGLTENVTEDLESIRQCRAGRPDAFAQLVRKYKDRVFNVTFRLLGDYEEARDVAQSTFIRAYESLAGFKGSSAFYTWLYRIAVNAALDARKKRKRRPEKTIVDFEEVAAGPRSVHAGNPGAATPVDRLIRTEQKQRISEAIDQLDDEHRTVVVLRDVEGLDYRDIAEVTGLPTGTVKSRLHRARLTLREKLKDLVS